MPLDQFDVSKHLIVMRFKYQTHCGGDSSRAFRLEAVCLRPLDLIKQEPCAGWLEASRLEREALAIRAKAAYSRFVSAVVVPLLMDNAPHFHEFSLVHPHPMFEMLGHKCDITFLKKCYEQFGRLSDSGVVFTCDNELEGAKAGLIRMERSKWRWKDMTEMELEDQGYPKDFRSSPDLALPWELIMVCLC
jgi:hypothetical protein